VHVVYT